MAWSIIALALMVACTSVTGSPEAGSASKVQTPINTVGTTTIGLTTTRQTSMGSSGPAKACRAASQAELVSCRPLRLPATGTSAACGEQRVARVGASESLGPGPVYPILAGPTATIKIVELDPSVFAPPNGPWYGAKIMWLVDPSYNDGVLIRVASVGDNGSQAAMRVQESLGDTVFIRPNSTAPDPIDGGARYSGYTAVTAPGCYVWQIDGANFSYSVLFRAKL